MNKINTRCDSASTFAFVVDQEAEYLFSVRYASILQESAKFRAFKPEIDFSLTTLSLADSSSPGQLKQHLFTSQDFSFKLDFFTKDKRDKIDYVGF